MSIKKSLANFFLCCMLAAGILISAHGIGLSAQPGLDLVYDGIGVATRTHDAANPFTAIQHWVKVVDYGGIADDGSSHTVTVSYPNGGPTYNLWFFEKRNDYSAVYEYWDDTIPQPIKRHPSTIEYHNLELKKIYHRFSKLNLYSICP